ncbi:histidinol dehydrogenase [Kamptonema cortianum]|nr:histidinol dehydrogenase [Kamptonema cortianum]MDL5046173.1 histidinol dehydrogenase [Oscillatoria amoena NRMC-F 0135]
MHLIDFGKKDFHQRVARLCQRQLYDAAIERDVRAIIERVGREGDKALVAYAAKFDRRKVRSASEFRIKNRVRPTQIAPALRKALADAHLNIQAFAKRGCPSGWSGSNRHGASVGERFYPYDRVGIYVPGGTAPLVSTCLMTATLAKVAGVKEIVICSPAGSTGKLHPALQYAAELAGATEIYSIGGAQAVAAMALGTKTIRPVQKIVGPGNAYVTTAKRLLYGHVALDMVAGPSEVVILADKSACPEQIAMDLLAQIEHGSGHERAILVTTDRTLIRQSADALEQIARSHSRREFARSAMKKNVYAIRVPSMGQGVNVVNEIAPEHLEIHAAQAGQIARKITRAGAIFIGSFTPEAVGDYVAGPSHVLPTGGAAASFSGLTVADFYRRTSFIQYDEKHLRKAASSILAIAEAEGLEAHGQSVAIRLRKS